MKKTQYLIILLALNLLSCSILKQNKQLEQQIGEIPFTISEGGHMVIELNINNEKISKFILDTGASGTVLDDDIAVKLNLSLEDGEFGSTGANGLVNNIKKTTEQQITLSDKVVLKGINFSVMDLSSLGEINGIIGFDIFRNYISQTNFDTKTITFYQKKGRPNTDGYRAMKFVESHCTPEIDISFLLENGEEFNGKVLFDTGNASSPLIINSPYKTKQNLPSKFKTLLTTEGRGLHSKSISEKGIIKSLNLGGFELGEVTVGLSNADKGVLSWEGYLGILGLEYISKFNLIIDYHRKKIYLKPNSAFSEPFEFPLSGIRLKREKNEIKINSVSRPSDAFTKGLRAGQRLISINGIEGRSTLFYKNLLKKEGKEVTVIVQLKNEELKTVKITLKRLL